MFAAKMCSLKYLSFCSVNANILLEITKFRSVASIFYSADSKIDLSMPVFCFAVSKNRSVELKMLTLGCPSEILGCPSEILGCPSEILGCPSEILGCPSEILGCPSEFLGCPSEILRCPSEILCCPGEILGCRSEVLDQISGFKE